MSKLATGPSTLAWANPPRGRRAAHGHRVARSGVACVEPAHGAPHRGQRHRHGEAAPVAYESGRGVTLTDVDGNTYLDFSSGIVITNIGHAHPRIAEAIGRAARQLDNVHDFATPQKVEALEALAGVTPPGMTLFTFFSSGTEAIEGAMRVARAATGKLGFISFHNDYHGRTGGSASVTSSRSSNTPRDPGTYLVPSGHAYRCGFCQDYDGCQLRCADFVGQSLAQNLPGQLAGAVIELVTNGNGATTYHPEYARRVADIVRAAGGLFIVDEIATGFGRTGAWFASTDEGVVPDVMALGKGMGNGFPVTAIAVHDELAESLAVSFPSTSYGGNPMACAAVVEVIKVMQEDDLVGHCRQMGERALARMREMADAPPDHRRGPRARCAAGHRARQGQGHPRAVPRGRQLRLPGGLPQGPGLGDGRQHPAHHATDRDLRRAHGQGARHRRGVDRRGRAPLRLRLISQHGDDLHLHQHGRRGQLGHADGRPRRVRLLDPLGPHPGERGEVLGQADVEGGHLHHVGPAAAGLGEDVGHVGEGLLELRRRVGGQAAVAGVADLTRAAEHLAAADGRREPVALVRAPLRLGDDRHRPGGLLASVAHGVSSYGRSVKAAERSVGTVGRNGRSERSVGEGEPTARSRRQREPAALGQPLPGVAEHLQLLTVGTLEGHAPGRLPLVREVVPADRPAVDVHVEPVEALGRGLATVVSPQRELQAGATAASASSRPHIASRSPLLPVRGRAGSWRSCGGPARRRPRWPRRRSRPPGSPGGPRCV